MAACILLVSISILLSFPSPSSAINPRALVAPISKDPLTSQYLVSINQRTPSVPIILSVDIGGRHLWVNCDSGYISSSYRPAHCRSALCSLGASVGCGDCFDPPGPGCNNDTCGVNPGNTFTHSNTGGELAVDALSLRSTDGLSDGPPISDPSFLFACAPQFLTRGLAAGSSGIAGLGRTNAAPPSQLAAWFNFSRRFAICLPSTTHSNGVVFFGYVPYTFLPNVDASQSLLYTSLLTNPVSTAGIFSEGEPSFEYFIGVTDVRVQGAGLGLNKTLLVIDKETGIGGTKISTVEPYTVLETTIYKALTSAFTAALAKTVRRAQAVAPFEYCYEAGGFGSTRVGPAVPQVDLVLQSDQVLWSIFGANSMVEAEEGTLCLGFLNGGVEPQTSIVIGGFQLQDNLLEFDLSYSRLGFSSSLLFRRTTCSNFNFTYSGQN